MDAAASTSCTLDAMDINRARIRPTEAPFHGIVPWASTERACFQDVRLIATNRPGRLELLDQGLRLGQTVQEIGRPISRRPVAINRPSRLCGRPAREWAASQSWAYLDTRGDGGGFRVDADLLE